MRSSFFRSDDRRSAGSRVNRMRVQTAALLRLPLRVQLFYLRALITARWRGDQYSLDVVTRPRDLGEILRLAADAPLAVELGTATAWTSIALCLANPVRRVVTYDPVVRPERELYLALVPRSVRDRIEFVAAIGASGPRGDGTVPFVFVDGSHQRDDTIATFQTWSPVVAPGGRIVFHDYQDPSYPGVTEAIEALAVPGIRVARMFVWCKPPSPR